VCKYETDHEQAHAGVTVSCQLIRTAAKILQLCILKVCVHTLATTAQHYKGLWHGGGNGKLLNT